jgi:tetratricopeptide (TPR) repeat protein
MHRRQRTRSVLASTLSATVAASLALACAGMGGRNPSAVVTRTPDGFTISDAARPRLGLRGEFEDANDAIAAGDVDRAIDLLEAITASDPDFAAPHINLAIAYRQAGRYEDAVTSLETAIAKSPRHPVAHNELGIAYRRLGRFEDARAAYLEALDLQPRFHYARKNLGILCDLFLADLACALENYSVYHEAVPDDAEVGIWIADLQTRIGQ